MGKLTYTASAGLPPQSFGQEWLLHKRGSEWWYATGILNSASGDIYSWQFTLIKAVLKGLPFWLLMTALTDFQTGEHLYAQKMMPLPTRISVLPSAVGIPGEAVMWTKDGAPSRVEMIGKGFTLALNLKPNKAPAWHCDNGVLEMGNLGDPKERTYYYSYTNVSCQGCLMTDADAFPVTGKCWIDKQGGPYNLINVKTHWEWFSFRFDDGEEVMLFSFPQSSYQDGTYIRADGSYERLNDYTIEPIEFTEAAGMRFACKWSVTLTGGKAGTYTIVPKTDGQLNLAYFELLADIREESGTPVGVSFVELLPGVYNEKIDPTNMFKKV
ncbi:MAG: hypothetical protein LBR73_07775 [Oscillospiraceae bacterium]|jgi:predicted secreted hydrolase|nr:hypothetical protein [Oscillospiraceae bacterium]